MEDSANKVRAGRPVGRDTIVDANAELDEPMRALLEQYARMFAAGEVLYREGEPANEAFMLHAGRVRLLKRVRNVERNFSVAKPGDLFGEFALMEGGVRSTTAVAVTDGTALALDRIALRHVIERHPRVSERLVAQLVRRLRDSEDQIEVLMLRDAQSRVVGALLKMSRGATAPAELHVTPVELSTRVGLDVEAVRRAVQRLREQHYVKILGDKFEIPDPEALRRLYALLAPNEELRGDR